MVVDTKMPPFISEAHISPTWWKYFLLMAQQFVPFWELTFITGFCLTHGYTHSPGAANNI